MEIYSFSSLLPSIKAKKIRGLLSGLTIFIVLLGNILSVHGFYVGGGSTKSSRNPLTVREPRLLSELNPLNRQGCLAKLLCGTIPEFKQSSSVTSPSSEWGPLDYAQMVKSVFENFSIKGVAKSLSEIRKSKNANINVVAQNKVEEKVQTELEDSTSSENDDSAEPTSKEESSNESSSLEQLLKDVGNIKRKLSPSKQAGMNEYVHKRIVTIRNPRFDKTMYLNKKHNEFSVTKNDTQKSMIADEVGKRFRSARQCRAFGILDRFANFSLCPFEPAELQHLIYKPSPVTTTTTTTESNQFIHKMNKLRHLRDYDEDEDENSPEISYRPSEFNSRSRNSLEKPIYREGEAERILNAMLSYGSISYPQSGPFGQATLGQASLGQIGTTPPSYSLQWVPNQNAYDDEDSVETRKKGKKGKGGNTENVRNPNIFHNENHVNIFSVHGYPKVKDKKSKEATEEEDDDEHGWEKNSPHQHHYHRQYRHPPPEGSESSSESESDEEPEKETSSEELELELHNKSNIIPPGMSVALSMNPAFTITNSHGSSGQQGPLLKSPSLLPNQPLLPDLDVLPSLPMLPKRTAGEDESESTIEESEDAEPENTALTLEDYEY